MTAFTVTDKDPQPRFEGRTDDGTLVGLIAYEADPDAVVLVHTEVRPEFEGQGVGGELVRQTLDLIRASGRGVVPLCPFVQAYLRRHPEYQDLVSVAPDTGQGG